MPSDPKKKSGLPGLTWRQGRGVDGTWVVVVSVPKEHQNKVVNAKGSPLGRLQRSTGTSSLRLAKQRFPQIHAALKAELAERIAGSSLESREEILRRGIASEYQRITGQDNDGWLLLQEVLQQSQQDYLKNLEIVTSPEHADDPVAQSMAEVFPVLLSNLDIYPEVRARELIADLNLPPASEKELEQTSASITHVEAVAKEEISSKQRLGHFHTPSKADQQIRSEALRPLAVSLHDALEIKASEILPGTHANYVGLIQRWIEVIDSKRLDSITEDNLNYFIRRLHTSRIEGGYGYGKTSASDQGSRMVSLIKAFNAVQRSASQRVSVPGFQRLRITKQDQIESKLRARDNAVSDENASAMLGYLSASNGEWAKFLVLLRLTGMRLSECLSICWNDIRKQDTHWIIDLTRSKTSSGLRWIPLNTKLQKYLLPQRGEPSQFVVNSGAQSARSPKNSAGYVFRETKARLNLQGNCTCHAFRRAVGGELQYSLTDHLSKTILGHSGGVTDRYTRLDLDKLADVVEVIGANWNISRYYPS